MTTALHFTSLLLQVPLSGNQCFRVQQNDRLAFLSTSEDAPIGHDFVTSGTDGLFYTHDGITANLPQLNTDYTFDTLKIPYEFAISVAMDLGELVKPNDYLQTPGLLPFVLRHLLAMVSVRLDE